MPKPAEACSTEACCCWTTCLKKREPLLFLVLLAVAVLVIALRIGESGNQSSVTDGMAAAAFRSEVRTGGFDLEGCGIPTDTLMSGGPPKDGIPALTKPRLTPGRDDASLHPADRVIGVEIKGEAVAYPLRILNWHECVNDELGGASIAVTYCPLCDSAFVFDRNVEGEILEFGISGLLVNSNVLLYDRRPPGRESSLWSQVAMRAVCGPAASRPVTLRAIPCELVTWKDWLRRHPKSLVLSFDTGHVRDYGRDPYADYFGSERLMFPVRGIFEDHQVPLQQWPLKEFVLLLMAGNRMRVYPYAELEKAADQGGIISDQIGDLEVAIQYDARSRTAHLLEGIASSENFSTAYSFWFAVHALQEGYDVYEAKAGASRTDAGR